MITRARVLKGATAGPVPLDAPTGKSSVLLDVIEAMLFDPDED